MMRGVGTIVAFLSAMMFPWPLTVVVALLVSVLEPLVPLAVGLFIDTLYYVPGGPLPLFTLSGALATLVAFFVRTRLKPGIIGE